MQLIAPPNPIQRLLRTLSRAINSMECKIEVRDKLDEAARILKNLSLPSDQSNLTIDCLKRVDRFIRSGEYGAAQWELYSLSMICLRLKAETVSKLVPHSLDQLRASNYDN